MAPFWLEFVGSKLFLGIVLLALAAGCWFGLEWFLTATGMDYHWVGLINILARIPGTLVLGIWGAVCAASGLSDMIGSGEA
ncbi:MAG: hypothetical protein ACF8R7_04075 [Phycisphaerales bacterium JB039]